MNIKDYPPRLAAGYYRVRETWEDAASQLGAFRLLANAMAKADANPGYFVFSNEGKPSIRSRSPALRKQRSRP